MTLKSIMGPLWPIGLNHLVLNVHNMEESHRFWTELLGFRQVATSRSPGPDGRPPMRFYSSEWDGKLHHHDIALVEGAALPAAPGHAATASTMCLRIRHPRGMAAADRFPDQAGCGVAQTCERGVTHSIHLTDPNGYEIELIYELPRKPWENDIEGALNYAVLT